MGGSQSTPREEQPDVQPVHDQPQDQQPDHQAQLQTEEEFINTFKKENNSGNGAENEICNIVVLGSSGVGKSSVISCLFPDNQDLRRSVSTGIAGKHTLGEDKVERDGVVYFDSAGLEPGNNFEQYLDKFKEFNSNHPVDMVWLVVSSTDPRLLDIPRFYEPVLSWVGTLKNQVHEPVPVVLVLTKVDELRDEKLPVVREWADAIVNGGDVEVDDETVSVAKTSIVAKAMVIAKKPPRPDDNGAVNLPPAQAESLRELVRVTKDLLPDGSAKNAFLRAQALDLRCKIELSTDAIIARIGTNTLLAMLNFIPLADGPLMAYFLEQMLDSMGSTWGVKYWMLRHHVLKHLVGKFGKWILVKAAIMLPLAPVVAALAPAAMVGVGMGVVGAVGIQVAAEAGAKLAGGALVDANHAPDVHVSAGMVVMLCLLRLHMRTLGRYVFMDETQVKLAVDGAVEEYEELWAARVNDFIATKVRAEDVLPNNQARLKEKILEFVYGLL